MAARSTADAFVRYAEVLFREYGHKVKYWLTINEQNMMILHGRKLGIINALTDDPEKELYQVNHTMFLAQAKAKDPTTEVSTLEASTYEAHQLDALVSPSLFGEPKLVHVPALEQMTDALLTDLLAYVDHAEGAYAHGFRGCGLLNAAAELPVGELGGIHLEGPFLSPRHQGAHATELLVAPTAEAVDALLNHPEVKALGFVGSSDIAQYIYSTAAAHGKRSQCFGGAKNHAIIMPDADMDQVADALVGAAFGSAGERCMALPVVVPVGERTAEALREKLIPAIEALRVGLDARVGDRVLAERGAHRAAENVTAPGAVRGEHQGRKPICPSHESA